MRSLHDLIGDDVRDEEEDTASLDGGLEGSYLSAGRRGNGYVPSSSVDEETETGRKGKSKERRGRLQMRGEVSIPEKYRGEKVSSKELRRSIEARLSGENEGTRGEDEDDEDEDEEDDEEDEDEEEDDAVDSITERTRSLRVSAQEGSEGDEEEEEDDEDDEGFGLDPSLAMEAKRIEEEEAGTLRLYSRKAEQEKSEEAVKGRHCSNQTSLWKKNVHVLVHIQRCLQVANRIPPLPPNDDAQAGRDEKGQSSALSRLCKEADSLVLSLRHLQSALCRQNDEVRKGVENPSRGDLFPAFSFSSSSSPGSVANGEGAGEVRDRKRRWQEAFPSEERRAWEIQVDRRQRRILSFCLKTFDLWKDKTQVRSRSDCLATGQISHCGG
uniref:AATF leucine zipper-containing domain-containing protein n=1 Tax=Chromera velia CCMP2878 TaxID=1169474 RepID=A0A0G4HU77_9ALVE|eukprot:Cvel_31774.t1-p1 / transcript=Cvel_31774.t1 / gene=Cvel_31774 / organism=Chromera_velia_CCMP2878 / gene_product=hypothetical protein / transcript_product=hypothetical protein / location=Cvel_scaffold4796:3858-6994(+) / protein_length=382 / sequence_SO=supercontig / SO=protein_coding / is_pseudo=false